MKKEFLIKNKTINNRKDSHTTSNSFHVVNAFSAELGRWMNQFLRQKQHEANYTISYNMSTKRIVVIWGELQTQALNHGRALTSLYNKDQLRTQIQSGKSVVLYMIVPILPIIIFLTSWMLIRVCHNIIPKCIHPILHNSVDLCLHQQFLWPFPS
jgi:hypothetical protein